MGGLSGGNYLYLNVSGGKLINKKKDIAWFGYEGTLIGIRRKADEYEGQPVQKIELDMKDAKSDEVARISFSEESWYSQGFFARINSIDLKRPFVLGASNSEKNEKISFCWLKQGADTVKVEKDAFPKPEKNSRGKMTYDNMLNAIDPILQELIESFAGSAEPQQTNYNKPANQLHDTGKVPPNPKAGKKDEKIYTNASEPSDDLPF